MRRWLILLGAALVILFNRLFVGEAFYWGLPSLQFIPWRAFALDQLRRGILPLWNPYNGAGTPLFANYQSALFYPFSWLSFLAPNVQVLASLMSVMVVAHLLIAGWGMWRLTGKLGLSDFGRAVSAIAFALSGYLVARIGTFPMISTAAWLPWLMLTVYMLITEGRFQDVGWVAFCSAMLLTAGHAQTAWYALLLTGVFSVWWTLRFRLAAPLNNTAASAKASINRAAIWSLEALKTASVRLLAVVVALLLGAGIAAFQLAATTELLGQSQRSEGAEYSFAMNYSYSPVRTLNLISPNVFGTPADGSYITEGAYFEDAVYIGFIPLVAAVAAVIGWVRRKQIDGKPSMWSVVPFGFGVIVIGYVLALGRFSPVFPFLYDNIPTFDLFQAPVRWHLWTVFGLSLLAGIGVSAWGRDMLTRRFARWGLMAASGTILAALIGSVFLGSAGEGFQVLVRAALATAVVGGIASWLTLRQPERSSNAHWRWSSVVLVVITLDLIWANWGLNPTTTPDLYTPERSTTAGRTYSTQAAEAELRYQQVFDFADYRLDESTFDLIRTSQLPNWNILTHAETLNNFEPLRAANIVRYTTLIDQAGARSDETTAPSAAPLLEAAGITRFYDGSQTWDVSNPDAQRSPQVQLIGFESACWQGTDLGLQEALSNPTWNPQTQVFLSGDGACPIPSHESAGTARITENKGNRVTITVNANRLSWLVWADVAYPGWRAFVDGLPVPEYRANLAFQAVQVDDGTHTVVFAYGPSWLLPGLFITILCTILMIVLIQVRESDEDVRGSV